MAVDGCCSKGCDTYQAFTGIEKNPQNKIAAIMLLCIYVYV